MSAAAPDVDASAFDLVPPGYNGQNTALCLHGLTGTPYEMRPVAAELASSGIRCVGPVMAGHAGSVEELARTTHVEWVDAARQHFEKLSAESERVFVAGMSMGGLVTLALALENRAAAVAVMGTPVQLPWWIKRLVPYAKRVYPYLSKSGGADIKDLAARERHPGLDAMPLSSIHEVVKLQDRVRPALSGITLPVFVAHGVHDRTAHPRNTRTIFAEISSGRRALFMGAGSGHVISVDHDGPRVAQAIARFFLRTGGKVAS